MSGILFFIFASCHPLIVVFNHVVTFPYFCVLPLSVIQHPLVWNTTIGDFQTYVKPTYATSDLLDYVYSIVTDVESVVEIRRFELSVMNLRIQF